MGEYQLTSYTPENTVIYAVGDIHGQLSLLQKLHKLILEDVKKYPTQKHIIIYIGDYIDRGPHSKEVIDLLLSHPLDGFKSIFIKGNHEDALLKFIEKPKKMKAWLAWGGDTTLRSYDVKLRNEKGKNKSVKELAKELAKNLPANHLEFYQNLKLYSEQKDYVFVHAGLTPDKDLEDQSEQDLLTIRGKFINSPTSIDKTIIFGHTIFDEPFLGERKIGIDTGAYASGKLTSAVLFEEHINFIST